jgi:hypothetical protein
MHKQKGERFISKGAHPTVSSRKRHPGMILAGLNLPGADLNSLRLVRRMKYMDVFHNPVAFLTLIGRFVRG